MNELDFYKGKRVFITGHTGFKGAWLCKILSDAGAEVTGFALTPPTKPSLFELSGVEKKITSVTGDIRDLTDLYKAFEKSCPEIVIHMAAQPIVLEGYKNPVYTYQTNVIGTVNILECVRLCGGVKSVLNVTTDKVYQNNEWEWGYREQDILNGLDPYSNSKSCSELVTNSYKSSFLNSMGIAVSTARAGNVIGGGDFASNRIIPDCVRAAGKNEPIAVRNPHSVRPFQHVLEPLFAYLLIARVQYNNITFAGSYNIGPDECDCVEVGRLVELFTQKWGNSLSYINANVEGPREANYLKLDCSRAKSRLGWKPRWTIETAIEKTVEWSKAYFTGADISACMDKQINDFLRN